MRALRRFANDFAPVAAGRLQGINLNGMSPYNLAVMIRADATIHRAATLSAATRICRARIGSARTITHFEHCRKESRASCSKCVLSAAPRIDSSGRVAATPA